MDKMPKLPYGSHRLRFTFLTLLLISLFINPFEIFAQQINEDIRIYSVFINRGTESATINWRTDPATKGKVEYADTEGEWKETPWSDNYREEHSLTILNLVSNATYLYRLTVEDSNGSIKVKTGNFTTLDSNKVGGSTTTAPVNDDDGGFKTLLTPEATPTPTVIPNVLGLQNLPYVPYYPVPVPIAYQTTLPSQSDGTEPVNSSPTTIPTSTPSPNAAFTQQNTAKNLDSLTLGIGLILGVALTLLLQRFNVTGPVLNRTATPVTTPQVEIEKQTEEKNIFNFEVNTD